MKKSKVLVVDDEEAIRSLLKDLLTSEGYIVNTAKDGLEAINKLKKSLPDIILLDCRMPKLDGYETIKIIRENPYWASIPVIFLTVKSLEEDQIKGIQLGADDYIVKPFNKKILVAKIDMLLKRKELSININPLTKLPGNIAIQQKFESVIKKKKKFIFLYIDLNNFKAFNDYYGFKKGDEVITHTAKILTEVLDKQNNIEKFIGHIGGDDFVVIMEEKNYKEIVQEIIDYFDKTIKNFYNKEDLEKGFITIYDRQGNLQNFPIMTISIVGVSLNKTNIKHYGQLSQRASELKKYAKSFNKSIFVEERRRR